MGITPEQLLKYAKDLSRESDEVAIRNAASRAYYGLFHLCGEAADEFELPEAPYEAIGKNSGTHSKLSKRFQTYEYPKVDVSDRIRAIRSIAPRISQCRDIRTKADYYIRDEFDGEQIERLFGIIKDIKDIIAHLRKGNGV